VGRNDLLAGADNGADRIGEDRHDPVTHALDDLSAGFDQ
jgi:hypothetical protein